MAYGPAATCSAADGVALSWSLSARRATWMGLSFFGELQSVAPLCRADDGSRAGGATTNRPAADSPSLAIGRHWAPRAFAYDKKRS